jgi:hypothetical protein
LTELVIRLLLPTDGSARVLAGMDGLGKEDRDAERRLVKVL